MTLVGKYLLGLLATALLVMGVAMPVAQADDDEDDDHWAAFNNAKAGKAVTSNPKWVAECGACHLAYPPRFLPAESWREMMSGLDKHFGSDASLDVETAREISIFLEENARRKPTSRDASGKWPLRISETRWFINEHDDVSQRIWKSPKVKSPSNCAACHRAAEQGDYSERNIRIPR